MSITAMALLVVAAAAGLYALSQSLVLVEKQVRSAASADARRNPLLAAERFLRELGMAARSVTGRDRLLDLPPTGDLVLVRELWSSMSAAREQRLLDWLEGGGHLALPAAAGDSDAPDGPGFLARLGLVMVGAGRCGAQAADQAAAAETGPEAKPVLRVRGHSAELEVDFGTDQRLSDRSGSAEPLAVDASGVRILRYPVGRGSVTILSGNAPFLNEHIGEGDHAFLLALLARPARTVWLLYGSAMPSLLRLVWEKQAPLLLSTLALGLLGVWRLARYSGPRHAPPPLTPSDLLRHLGAAAGYHWRQDQGKALLEVNRQALEQDWLRRHPVLERLDRRERYAWIANYSGLTPQEVAFAFHGRIGSESDLIRVGRLQQRLLPLGDRS